MTTVYAVSTGEYSSWGIAHVFTTRELAEAFLAKVDEHLVASAAYDHLAGYGGRVGHSEYNSDVMELDVLDELPPLYAQWQASWEERPYRVPVDGAQGTWPQQAVGPERVTLYMSVVDGDSDEARPETAATELDEHMDMYHWNGKSRHRPDDDNMGARPDFSPKAYAYSQDPERALKILQDRVAHLRAIEAGIADP